MENNEFWIPDTSFCFTQRPETIPGDLRPIWKIGLVLLILQLASRGGKSSFGRLHVLNWAVQNKESRIALDNVLAGKFSPMRIVVRIEPSLNRAVDFAYGEGLVEQIQGNRINLTFQGKNAAKLILDKKDIYSGEREFLNAVGKRLTERLVNSLLSGEE